MDRLTFALLLVLAMSLVVALPVFAEGYRFLTRSKRKAATRARLARLPQPDEALKDADHEEIVTYLWYAVTSIESCRKQNRLARALPLV